MSEDLDQYSEAYGLDSPYALDNRLILNWYPNRILRLAKSRNSLLELGIGHGYVTDVFRAMFRRHVIIEGSLEMIRKYRASSDPPGPEEIHHALFEDWESEERFDVIAMGFVLEHVDDPEAVLHKYQKSLAKHGSLFIAVPNYEALNKRLGQAAGLLDDPSRLSDEDRALGHQRLFSLASLRDLVKRAGYQETTVEGIFLKPLTTRQILDLGLSDEILRATLEVGVDYPELCVAILMEVTR